MKSKSRSKLNRRLYLRGGFWWTRIIRNGIEVRQSTDCPVGEIISTRKIRDERLSNAAENRAGLGRPVAPLLLGELIDLYMQEECAPYDREKGAEQPGTKRSTIADRSSKKRLLRHLPANLSAALVDRERLLDCAREIERETPTPAPGTRRKTFAFLRRVFSWALEHPSGTGIVRTPFAELTRGDRAKLFPRSGKRGYLYTPDELRGLYERLPSHLLPFVRFAVHTGCRFSELTSLRWGAVNLDGKVLTIEARFAKNKREREVALGEVAGGILERLRPAQPEPGEHVFIGRRGDPIRDVRSGYNAAVSEVGKPSRPGEKRLRFHDLRKTAATRIEAVSSHALAKAFLGHADSDVTNTYILASLDAMRDAVNRAARSIDGEIPAGTLPFPERRDGTKDGTEAISVRRDAGEGA